MNTTATSEAIKAYSIAVEPDMWAGNALMRPVILSWSEKSAALSWHR
jgi:hypothetical protein